MIPDAQISERGPGLRHQRQPLLDQHVLVPLGGEPARPGPDVGVQVGVPDPTAGPERHGDLVVALDRADKFLVDAAEEGGPGFGGQGGHVLGGQGVALSSVVVIQVSGGEHAVSPFPYVPFGQPGPGGQFSAGGGAARGQILEQPGPVAQGGQHDRGGRSAVGQDPSGELRREVLVHRDAPLVRSGPVACTRVGVPER